MCFALGKLKMNEWFTLSQDDHDGREKVVMISISTSPLHTQHTRLSWPDAFCWMPDAYQMTLWSHQDIFFTSKSEHKKLSMK